MPDQMDERKPKVLLAEQDWFRPEEAAAYIRVGRSTMFKILREEAIPTATVGRVRLIRRRDLDAFLKERSQPMEGLDGR